LGLHKQVPNGWKNVKQQIIIPSSDNLQDSTQNGLISGKNYNNALNQHAHTQTDSKNVNQILVSLEKAH
jgi:hypothetical protein